MRKTILIALMTAGVTAGVMMIIAVFTIGMPFPETQPTITFAVKAYLTSIPLFVIAGAVLRQKKVAAAVVSMGLLFAFQIWTLFLR